MVLTRNRRVMVSVGRDGALRLHRSFARAPDGVLTAVARLWDRDGRRRGAARRAVRRFLADALRDDPPPAPRPRRRRVPASDAPHLARLRAEFERVNAERFDGALPAVPIFLSGRMRRRNGHFSARPPEIVISRRLCTEADDGEAEMTLRHEMIHLWQHVTGRKVDHGAEFRRMARRLDVHPRATRTVAWREG